MFWRNLFFLCTFSLITTLFVQPCKAQEDRLDYDFYSSLTEFEKTHLEATRTKPYRVLAVWGDYLVSIPLDRSKPVDIFLESFKDVRHYFDYVPGEETLWSDPSGLEAEENEKIIRDNILDAAEDAGIEVFLYWFKQTSIYYSLENNFSNWLDGEISIYNYRPPILRTKNGLAIDTGWGIEDDDEKSFYTGLRIRGLRKLGPFVKTRWPYSYNSQKVLYDLYAYPFKQEVYLELSEISNGVRISFVYDLDDTEVGLQIEDLRLINDWHGAMEVTKELDDEQLHYLWVSAHKQW
jgi:hypothetical protein